jgi:hypothetical protein
LSDYLAVNLAPRDPELAAKVRGFDEEELDRLSDCVRELRSAQRTRSAYYSEAIGAS